jgi:uncharacterized membrane protein YedE/YeeE
LVVIKAIAAFASGALFAVGLLLGGMTRPERVIGFLDLGGAWDPTLAFVMGGAIAVHVLGLGLVRRRAAPLYDTAFHLPASKDLNARLFLGSGLFGVGWGLAGYCPGPALVSLGAGGTTALVFVGAAIAGMLAQHLSPAARVG